MSVVVVSGQLPTHHIRHMDNSPILRANDNSPLIREKDNSPGKIDNSPMLPRLRVSHKNISPFVDKDTMPQDQNTTPKVLDESPPPIADNLLLPPSLYVCLGCVCTCGLPVYTIE